MAKFLILVLFFVIGEVELETNNTNKPTGTTITADQGSFSSQNYPQDYPRNFTSVWNIWTGSQSTATLQITFSYFDIESCRNCSCDYVEITTSASSQRLCGSVLPNGDGVVKFTHVSGFVKIKFVSDSNAVQRSGFFADYIITGKTVSTTPTTTLGSTVSCFAVQCPKCSAGEMNVYRYYHNDSCPSYCDCEPTSTTLSPMTTLQHSGSTSKKPCVETYAYQGYIKTYTIKRPYLHGYPPLYLLNYDCKIRIDLGNDYILKDKSVRIRFLKFDLDHCKYGYDGHSCYCDYLKLMNVRGLENARVCDGGYIDYNKDYYFRPSSRSDRYIEMTFHSNGFLAKTGYLFEYEVIGSHFPICSNSTCPDTCGLGHVEDFAGCTLCQCVTTTTTTTRATTTRTTTPLLFKSKLLSKIQGFIDEMQLFYKQVQHSRLIN